MSTIDLKARKQLIIQQVKLVEDEWLLKAISKLLDLDESIDLDEYNQDIENSLSEIESEQFISHDQLIEESKKW